MVTREEPAPRSDFKVWRRLATRWDDNDAYGHVNNTVFYQWFDTAVNAWLIDEGLLDIDRGSTIALVASTRCSYFAPLAFPQDVDVGLRLSRLGKSSVCYRVGVFATSDDRAAAQGEFVHVLVDRATRRPVPIPAQWKANFAAIS